MRVRKFFQAAALVFFSGVVLASDPTRILNQPYYPTKSEVGPKVLFIGGSREFAERASTLFNQKMVVRRMATRVQWAYSEKTFPEGEKAKVLFLSTDATMKDVDAITQAAKSAGMKIVVMEIGSETDPRKLAEKAEPLLEKALDVP